MYVGAETTLHIPAAREAVAGAGALLATAVHAPETGGLTVMEEAVDRFLEMTSREAIERRQLMTLLNRHEWNIARVARALGCNRVTVYKRMRRLGVPRLRVCRGENPASA